MSRLTHTALIPISALLLALGLSPVAQAMDFSDMFNPNRFNPSRWMGGSDNDEEQPRGQYEQPYYPGGAYGPAPGYAPYGTQPPVSGYGAPAYGPGYVAPGYGTPGYGAPGTAPGYGYGQSLPTPPPAYGQGFSTVPTPQTMDDKDRRIEELQRRLDELESRQAPARDTRMPTSINPDWRSAPSFRPMEQQ